MEVKNSSKGEFLFFILLAFFIYLMMIPCIACANMQIVGRIPTGPSFDVVESNGYLFAAQGAGIRVYDVSTAQKISSLTWSGFVKQFYQGSAIRGLTLDGNTLYIADADELAIADVSNPTNPSILGTFVHGTGGTLIDVVVKGNYAYLAIPRVGILVVDVTNKAHPTLVRTLVLTALTSPGDRLSAVITST